MWNHTFYWNSLSPQGGGEPTGPIKDAILKEYGSFDDFKKAFSDVAAGHFGSGWAWVVKTPEGGVKVGLSSHKSDVPDSGPFASWPWAFFPPPLLEQGFNTWSKH